METTRLKSLIREIPDFPKPGISFKDVTTLLKQGEGLKASVEAMARPFEEERIDQVVAIESRGFIFGAPIAVRLGCGFVPVRKPGKLPAAAIKEEYELEYGTDAVEIHRDAIEENQRVLIVDDLLATGGTMAAACRLIERLGAQIVGISFLIELSFLNGREKLRRYRIESVVRY